LFEEFTCHGVFVREKAGHFNQGEIGCDSWQRCANGPKSVQAKQRAMFKSNDVGQKMKRYFQELSGIIGENDVGLSTMQQTTKALQLIFMTRSARRTLSLLLDATGHQIFHDGLYNGALTQATFSYWIAVGSGL
jgi:hypothetical protein